MRWEGEGLRSSGKAPRRPSTYPAFLELRDIAVPFRDDLRIVTGRENERYVALMQGVGKSKYHLPLQVDIKHGAVDTLGIREQLKRPAQACRPALLSRCPSAPWSGTVPRRVGTCGFSAGMD